MPAEDRSEALRRSTSSADQDSSPDGTGTAVESCPKASWIEIQMVGEDGSPISGETYRMELPDGTVVEGVLDAEGVAAVENIDPGSCKIGFPDLDCEAWEPIEDEGAG